MTMCVVRSVLLLVVIAVVSCQVTFKNGGYEDIVVTIHDNVPANNCRHLLRQLEYSLSNASHALYTALSGRARFTSITVVLPDAWPNNCTSRPVTGFDGFAGDVRIEGTHPVHGSRPWTQQSGGCGKQGEYISVGFKGLDDAKTLGALLMVEWAKYRYGVFDEVGYSHDPVYPLCYHASHDQEDDVSVTGCSDKTIMDLGVCDGSNPNVDPSLLVSSSAATSLLFAPNSANVGRFCDAHTHDSYAPTKHNQLCRRSSATEVIDSHEDFRQGGGVKTEEGEVEFRVKRRVAPRFVLAIDDSQAMSDRDTWTFLRAAVRKLAVLDLVPGTDLGLVLFNETGAAVALKMASLNNDLDRDTAASNLPYTPGDGHGVSCASCALKEAVKMLEDRAASNGPAPSTIIVISPSLGSSSSLRTALSFAEARRMGVAWINYPAAAVAAPPEGVASVYNVQELRYNMATSYVTTYFKLAEAMRDAAAKFSTGFAQQMPVEIHRREFWDEGRSSITGSFVLEESLSEPARFVVYTHNTENPLIRTMSLVSPSQVVHSTRSDALLPMKMLTLKANINETGTWTYHIERFPGSPQPHVVQVVASPRSRYSPVVTATATVEGCVVRVTVKRATYPVLDARVEVTAIGTAGNATRERFTLLDTGGGEPDTTKGDGVYSRVFSPSSGPGTYSLDITVTDNANTAYSYHDQALVTSGPHQGPCCGSQVPTPQIKPTSPFTRVLATVTAHIPECIPVGRVGDLRADILKDQLKARLSFTAPDPKADRYTLRMAESRAALLDSPTAAGVWEHGSPFPLESGADSSFTLDFTRNPSLMGTPLYFCLQSHAQQTPDNDPAECSNVARVLMPPPPPPPPTDYPSTSDTDSTWTSAVIPSIAAASDLGLQLILPVAIGVLLLVICVAVYCVMCMRRGRKTKKKDTQPIAPPTVSAAVEEKPRPSIAPPVYEEKLVDAPTSPARRPTLSPYQSWTASQLLHEHERRHSPCYDYYVEEQAPPVPPLPTVNGGVYEGPIYGVHPGSFYHRVPFVPSIQGSMSSVSSGDKKKRSVTMV